MRYFHLAVLFFISLNASAGYMNLTVLEDSLVVFLDGIGKSTGDEDKVKYSSLIDDMLRVELANPEMFDYEFKKVKKMAILKPEDGSFILFNWNIPLNNGVNEFRCYLVLPSENANIVEEFNKPKRQDKKLESRYLELDRWYGCLYYDIITVKKGKIKYYTLLGYSPEKKAYTKKYIDILTIKNNVARLGAPKFKNDRGTKKRVIFEFSAEVSMTVRWQEESERIILDHLEPRSPEMKGNFQFYGPDGTFDAYVLIKDTWELQKNVDYRSIKKSDKVYKDPRFFKRRRN